MRMTRSGKPGRTAVIDVLEDFSMWNDTPGSSATQRAILLAGDLAGPTVANTMFQNGGGAPPSLGVTKNEAWARLFAPGSAQIASAFSQFGFPIGRDLSRFPVSIRQQKRFVWDTLIQRTVALSGTAEMLVGLADDGVDLATPPGGIVGIRSLASENAGRWTSKYNLTNGGAIVSAGDSGVAPDGTPQHIRFEYFDITPAPRLLIWINGVLKFTHTGATLPTMANANEPWNLLIVAGSAAHVIGQQDHNFYNRYTVELL